MKCILLHGLGQKPSDWDNTIKYIDNGVDVSCPALFKWLAKTEASYNCLYRGSVSYTHLDVYKRQALRSLQVCLRKSSGRYGVRQLHLEKCGSLETRNGLISAVFRSMHRQKAGFNL